MLVENIFPISHDLIQPVLVVVTIPLPQRSDSEAALGYFKRIKFKLYRPEMTKHYKKNKNKKTPKEVGVSFWGLVSINPYN